jgi:hypothetical protein
MVWMPGYVNFLLLKLDDKLAFATPVQRAASG